MIGDPLRLRQVLVNLVGNAIKFTERGTVRMLVSCAGGTDTQAWLRLAVEDTGIGIASEAQARLFQPFSQAVGSTTRKYGGTGLGLAISRRLVQLMGGDIQLASVAGQGSTFSFQIEVPVAEDLAGESTVAAQTPAVPSTDLGARVLLVEDNEVNQRVAGHLLRRAGCTMDVAANGEIALAMLAAGRYDLVLMDCQMPVMDGYDATAEWRRREAPGARLPVIAMTANAMQGDRERCLAAGMDDYVAKPIQPAELVRVMSRWAGRSRADAA